VACEADTVRREYYYIGLDVIVVSLNFFRQPSLAVLDPHCAPDIVPDQAKCSFSGSIGQGFLQVQGETVEIYQGSGVDPQQGARANACKPLPWLADLGT